MGTVVQVFVGEYDLAHQLSVRADLDSLCDEPEVIFDMSGVTYLDSTFVTRYYDCICFGPNETCALFRSYDVLSY